MARVLLTVLPLAGHLNPALSLAQELTSRGHQVAWAAHGKLLADRLPPHANVYALDAEYSPQPLGEARGFESVRHFHEDYLLPLTRHALGPLEAAVGDFKPDVMAVDHQMLGGALVARKLGLPWVSLVTTTAAIVKLSPMLDTWLAERHRELQQDYLLPELIVERPDFSPHSVIVFSVAELMGTTHERIPAPYAFVGPASSAGRRDVAFPWEWLRDDRRLILVSLGTVSRDRDLRFFEAVMSAVAQMPDLQAVMVAPHALAEQAPENVLVAEFVPQLALLDRAAGMICHAGHNSVCEALARGLPLIVSPIRDDQPIIARQVIDAGAGLFVRHGKVTPATARSAIERLLGDADLAANAGRLASALKAAPGVAGAADIVVSLSRQGSPCT